MGNWKVDADDIRSSTNFEDALLYKTGWIDNLSYMHFGTIPSSLQERLYAPTS